MSRFGAFFEPSHGRQLGLNSLENGVLHLFVLAVLRVWAVLDASVLKAHALAMLVKAGL